MRAHRTLIAALVLLASLAGSGKPARAQVDTREGIALQNQILELRSEIQSLRNQIGRGGPTNLGGSYSSRPSGGGSNDLVAQLLSRVDALEEQVRQLRGRVDETQNQVQQQGANLGKRIDDLAFQVQGPQGGAPPPSPGAMPQPMQPYGQQPSVLQPPQPMISPQPGNLSLAQPPQPPSGPVRRTPEMSIQEGNAALGRHDYMAAEQDAREVLSNYRTSPRAYDAQFLLAQALLGQRQFSQAAIAYDDTYNRARKGAHAQDALLGLANSLIAINEKKAACDTLTKLRAEYPSPKPDLREPIATAAQRSGCR